MRSLAPCLVVLVACIGMHASQVRAHSGSVPAIEVQVPAGRGWWCAQLPSGEGCFRTRAQCEGIRTRTGGPQGAALPPACTSRQRAWCFAPRYMSTGSTGSAPSYRLGTAVCAGDMRACTRRRREMLAIQRAAGLSVDVASVCTEVP